MKNTLETRLGIFFALALIAAFIMLEIAGGGDLFKKGTRLRARFNNVQELKQGDPVKLGGKQIGQVEGIQFAGDKLEVVMRLTDPTAQVKTDSKATIKFTGLMGQNYISLDFGSPTGVPVEENTELQTQEQADLSSLMEKLDDVASGVEALTKNFSGENFSVLLGPLTDFLKENSPRLTAILGNMQNISTQISEGQGTIGKLIYEDALYNSALGAVTNLQETANEIKVTVGRAQNVIDQVNSGQGTLGKLLTDEKLYAETSGAMLNLREILEKINRGQGSVGKLVNDEAFYKNVRVTLQKVDKATEGLEDQGPLSVLGIAVNSLF